MAPPKQNKAAAARQARVEQMRKQQAAREARVKIVTGVIAGVVVLAIVAVIVVATVHKHSAAGQEVLPAGVDTSQAVTVMPTPASTTDASGIEGVKAWVTATDAPSAIPHTHVSGPVTYPEVPPVGGPHNPVWANCGVYDAPITTERAVHDLEHGAIWITYRKGTAASVVTQLRAFVNKQGDATFNGSAAVLSSNGVTKGESVADKSGDKGRYMDLTPWSDDSLSSPIMLSAWGRQLGVDSPTDPRMQQFVDDFRTNLDLSYEAGISPCNGEPVNDSGKPLQDAS